MKSSHLVTTLFLGVILGLCSVGAKAQGTEAYVYCDNGDSLNDAIRMEGDWGRPLELYVIGTCREDRITVPRGRLTINGLPDGSPNQAVIEGNIINWGMTLAIRNITITGEGAGVTASVGRTRLINVDISHNYEEGIVIDGGGAVYVNNSRIQHNGLEGVSVETGVFQVTDSEISDNQVGIDTTMGRIVLNEGTSVVENRGAGVIGRLHSSIAANGPVTIERNGEHGVQLMYDSGFLANGDVNINRNGRFDVVCEDHESSAWFEDGYPRRVRCPGFRR
jgi:hypothetical protein